MLVMDEQNIIKKENNQNLKSSSYFHYVTYTILFSIVIFSVIQIVQATTPNPGHPWSELGDGVFVFSNGQTTTPYTYTFPAANTTVLTTNEPVTVAQGGTGVSSLTAYALLAGGVTSTDDVQQVSGVGEAGQILTSNGAGALPTWQAAAGVTNWDEIGDPSGNGSIAMGSTVQTLDWGTATTQNAFTFTGGALTTGKLLSLNSNTLTSGSLLDITSAGTGGLTGQRGLNIGLSGINATGGQTTYGAYISNTHTGTTSTNVGLYVTALGGTTANYAAIFDGGNVGIGTTTPSEKLDVNGNIFIRNSTGYLKFANGFKFTNTGVFGEVGEKSITVTDSSDNVILIFDEL